VTDLAAKARRSRARGQRPAAAAAGVADVEAAVRPAARQTAPFTASGQRAAPAGPQRGGRGTAAAPSSTDTLWTTVASLSAVMNAMQAADVSPTSNTLAAVTAAQANAARVMARWHAFRTIDLPALNLKLKAQGMEEVRIE
jgi:hypothetical protein